MRTQTLIVTRRCNQSCGFCSRVDAHATPAADPPLATLRSTIESAVRSGVRSIVLSGGEPMVRQDLYALVRLARALGAEEVALETNATLITSTQTARALKTVGVTAVQVSLVATDAERHLALVGRDGRSSTSPAQVLAGIGHCLEAGLDVTIRLPLAEGLAPASERLVALHQRFPQLKHVVLACIGSGERALRPDARGHQALEPAALSQQLSEVYKAATKIKVELALSPDHPAPPCVVDVKGGARRLFSTHLRTEPAETPNAACSACASCGLASRCTISAQQLAMAGGAELARPIADAKEYLHPTRNAGSRLRVLGEKDVENFFHVDYEFGAEVGRSTSRVGILYRCNQVCTFCELADMDTDVPPQKVMQAIDESAARGSFRLIVTGGEPTLSPKLVEYVAYARSKGFSEIELQTNAILLDKPGAVEELVAAGLTNAQVSLHGPDSAISDRLTAAPGTHKRTLGGVDNLLKNGVKVLLNHLVFKDNCHLLVDFIDLVEQRWGAYKSKLIVQFHSARNEFPDREEGLRHIARYSDYGQVLQQAIDHARTLHVPIYDLQDPTGIPSLCILGGDEEYLGPIVRQNVRPRVHEWEAPWLTRVEACKTCEVAEYCIGVPKHYLKLHGEAEFKPLKRPRDLDVNTRLLSPEEFARRATPGGGT